MSSSDGNGMVAPPGIYSDTAEIYSRSGIGTRVGFGSRPSLVVVDLQNGFTDPACTVGGELSEVVEATARLLEVARARSIPVAFTAVAFEASLVNEEMWLRKMPGLKELVLGSHWCEIDERVRPLPTEPVWMKRASSAFFGTPLLPFLVTAGCDALVVTGCVTSGCVRATVVDSVSWGYKTIVPLECVGDRAEGPHAWSLFDMDAKYADVEPLEHVMAAIESAGGVPAAAGSSD